MIYLYTGTPGSGKSLDVAMDIVYRLKKGKNIIANFPINTDSVKKIKGEFYYKMDMELTVKYLVDYAHKNHKVGKENQTLLVIDEAQRMFNCRDFSRKDRFEWVKFFSMHRHLGYNCILVTQNDKMIDKQIRALVEYEKKHRKINNFGMLGFFASLTFQTYFISIDYWYGMKGKDAKLGISFFRFKKKYQQIYNSYEVFDEIKSTENKINLVKDGGDRASGEAPYVTENILLPDDSIA
jgi:zona occludens toxin (predicted ATPase)